MLPKLTAALCGAVLCASLSTMAHADTYKVGTHPTFAPFEFSSTKGEITGFDLDLIKAIAKANGDEVQIESMPFDGLIPALLTGNLDLIISGMTITEARKHRVDFSKGYYDSNLSILIHKDKADVYTSAESLKGKTICVQIGTTGHAFADTISPDHVKALNNEPDAILELSNGGCEAVINDRPVNLYYLKRSKLTTLSEFVDPKFKENVDSFGIAVRKGQTDLLEKINTGLEKLEQSGELDQLHIKWFGQSASADKGVPPANEASDDATVGIKAAANQTAVEADAI